MNADKIRRHYGDRMTEYADRAAWFAQMGPYAPDYTLGASTFASILGVSPYSTPWDTWTKSRGERPDDDPQAHQQAGHDAEAYLGHWYRQTMGVRPFQVTTRVAHPEHPWLRVSPDLGPASPRSAS